MPSLHLEKERIVAYLRPARIEEVVDFLFDNEALNEHELAQKLIEMFDVLILSNTPT